MSSSIFDELDNVPAGYDEEQQIVNSLGQNARFHQIKDMRRSTIERQLNVFAPKLEDNEDNTPFEPVKSGLK